MRVGTRWSRNSGSLKKKSTECVLFFVYSLLLSTGVPGHVCRCAVGPCSPVSALASRTRRPGQPISRAWGFRASPLTGLNKESAFGLETHAVSVIPSAGRSPFPCGEPGPSSAGLGLWGIWSGGRAWSELQTHCEGPWVPGFRGHLPGSEEETSAHTWVGLARPPPPLRE